MAIPYPKRNPGRPGGGGYRPAPRPMPTAGARQPLAPYSLPKGAGLGLRGLGRLVPWLGLALTAWELYELYKWWHSRETGFYHGVCGGSGGHRYYTVLLPCGSTYAVDRTNYNNTPDRFLPSDFQKGWVEVTDPHPDPILASQGYVQVHTPEIFQRDSAQVTPQGYHLPPVDPEAMPDPMEDPLPWVAPMVDPFSNPINQPLPEVPPLPYPAIPYRLPSNPYRAPSESPQRGNDVPYRLPVELPELAPATVPGPGALPAPVQYPIAPAVAGQPGPSATISPNGNVRRNPTPAPRNPSRPKVPGVEVKKTLGGTGVWKLTNAVTEARDFVRELWKGLDPSWRAKQNPDLWRIPFKRSRDRDRGKPTDSKGKFAGPRVSLPTFQKMLQDIYKGIREDKMDWQKALDNIIEDQIQDRVHGKIGRKAAEGNERLQNSPYGTRRPVGYGGGPLHGQM